MAARPIINCRSGLVLKYLPFPEILAKGTSLGAACFSSECQRERNGALFGVHGLVRSKVLDAAEIVRDACLQQAEASGLELPHSVYDLFRQTVEIASHSWAGQDYHEFASERGSKTKVLSNFPE
jgi:hypothetical protein